MNNANVIKKAIFPKKIPTAIDIIAPPIVVFFISSLLKNSISLLTNSNDLPINARSNKTKIIKIKISITLK